MILPLALLISIAGVFHLMGIHSIGALFTAISLAYGLVVGYLSIKEVPDKFFFTNAYLLTFTLPGSIQLSHTFGYTFPVNIIVWFTSYFAGGLVLWIFFIWRRLEREILVFFLIFLFSLSLINFFTWVNVNDLGSYPQLIPMSFRFLYLSLLNLCMNPEFIFRTESISVQIFIAPFVFLVVSLFVLVKKL